MVGLPCLAMLAPLAAQAEWQPKGPISLLISFPGGGGGDTQARLIAEELEAKKGWKIIPETVLGKGGGVLAARLAKLPGDGTALGFIVTETLGYNMLAEKSPGYSEKDFTLLSTTAGTQLGIVARSSKGWKSIADVTAAIKNGNKVAFGVMSQQLADGSYLLGNAQGVKYNIVNLKGGKAVLDAIAAGDIDLGWVAGPQQLGVKSGELMNLVSGEATRLKMSPNAPTLKELGLKFDFGTYFMFVAPKGLPNDAREAITKAIMEVVNDPKSKANAYINKTIGEPTTISGLELDKYMAEGLADAKTLLIEASK